MVERDDVVKLKDSINKKLDAVNSMVGKHVVTWTDDQASYKDVSVGCQVWSERNAHGFSRVSFLRVPFPFQKQHLHKILAVPVHLAEPKYVRTYT